MSAPRGGAWRRFWERAPRQLRFTRAGRVLVGLALLTGFAAVNTGHNLLFLGWGLVLSTILLSGFLSESVLRALHACALPPPHLARAKQLVSLPIELANRARLQPSYALEVAAMVRGPRDRCVGLAPFVLSLPPRGRLTTHAQLLPLERGRHVLEALRVGTTYPFGFFDKSRRFVAPEPCELWVAPEAVPVQAYLDALESVLGESPAGRAGAGEDFYDLRPFRPGDDLRRVAWRRSAKTGRWVMREQEAAARGAILVELALAGAVTGGGELAERSGAAERAIAVAGSLCEALLARGHAVGLLGPGLYVAPAVGLGQAWGILAALARLTNGDRLPAVPVSPDLTRVVVATPEAAVRPGAARLLRVGLAADGSPAAQTGEAALRPKKAGGEARSGGGP